MSAHIKFKTLLSVTLLSYSLLSVATLESDSDKLSYSLGVTLAEQLQLFDDINAQSVIQGVNDFLESQSLQLTPSEISYFVQQAQEERNDMQQAALHSMAENNRIESQYFLDENSKKPGVVVLESGLQYRVLKKGEGVKPILNDYVTVDYEGRLIDGALFESSYEQNKAAKFQLNRVIAGWAEGIQHMPEGSTWELFVPPALAYGSDGIPGVIAPNMAIIFKIELKSVSGKS